MRIRDVSMARTLRLESRVGEPVLVSHAIVRWMLEHTCMAPNTMSLGTDGNTSWFRVRGRAPNQRLSGSNEALLNKLPATGHMSAPDGNMGAKPHAGIHFVDNIGTPLFHSTGWGDVQLTYYAKADCQQLDCGPSGRMGGRTLVGERNVRGHCGVQWHGQG